MSNYLGGTALPVTSSVRIDSAPLRAEDASADRVFKALASKPRREILRLLASGAGTDDERCCSPDQVCACVFSEKLGLGPPTVSHHMKALVEAGLVTSEKRGLWVYYRLLPEVLHEAAETLEALATASHSEGVCR